MTRKQKSLAGISFQLQSIFTLLPVVKEIELNASLGYLTWKFDQALKSIANKTLPVEQLIGRTIPLANVQESFENLSSGDSCDIKIILEVT